MRLSPWLIALVPLACGGDIDDKDTGVDTAGDADTDADTDTDTDADTDTGGFDILAIVLDFALNEPAPLGLCVDLVDPSPLLTGGTPLVLQSQTVEAGGNITFLDVQTDTSVGLLMSADNCNKTTPTTAYGYVAYPSATGIPFDDVDGLGSGDSLIGQTALVISRDFMFTMQSSAAAVGYGGILDTEGFMFGLVTDSVGIPITGATVTCANCGPTYYMDDNPYDGLFGDPALNTATLMEGGGVFMIPGAPVDQYTADDGGAHTFDVQLNGSDPGVATITKFVAN